MTRFIDTGAFKASVLDAGTPVLVDFTAAWCPPCQAQSPILDDVAADLGDEAEVVKVDVDAEPELARLFQVRSIPTLLVFRSGAVVERFQGLTARSTLVEALRRRDAA